MDFVLQHLAPYQRYYHHANLGRVYNYTPTICKLFNHKIFVNIKYLAISGKLKMKESLIHHWLLYKTNYYLI